MDNIRYVYAALRTDMYQTVWAGGMLSERECPPLSICQWWWSGVILGVFIQQWYDSLFGSSQWTISGMHMHNLSYGRGKVLSSVILSICHDGGQGVYWVSSFDNDLILNFDLANKQYYSVYDWQWHQCNLTVVVFECRYTSFGRLNIHCRITFMHEYF